MTYGHRVLCLALATAGATMFVGLWLGIDMMPQREAPVIQAPEPYNAEVTGGPLAARPVD